MRLFSYLSEVKRAWKWNSQFKMALGPYQKVIVRRWYIYKKLIKKFLPDFQKEIRILDAGCGDGVNLGVFQNIFEDIKSSLFLYGADINLLRLRRAQRFLSSYVLLVQADIRGLPFSTETFHVILLNHVLEHIKEDNIVLQELKRVLIEKGILILAVPNEGCFLALMRNWILQPSILLSTDHVHFYTLRKLLRVVKGIGFKVLAIKRVGFFFPHLYLYQFLVKSDKGNMFLNKLSSLFPSQSAEIILVLQK